MDVILSSSHGEQFDFVIFGDAVQVGPEFLLRSEGMDSVRCLVLKTQ
jgi:hypothetical protein